MNNTTALTAFQGNGGVPAKRWDKTVTPSVDIIETPGAFVVMLDLPGAQKETIAVGVEKDMLHISAPVRYTHKENAFPLIDELNAAQHQRYQRSFILGEGVNAGQVDASFEDGVLILKFAKREKSTPREIPVR